MRTVVMLVSVLASVGCDRGAAPPTNRQLATGNWSSCLLDRGAVTCWGKLHDDKVHRPMRIPFENATQISIGLTDTCIRDTSAHVRCWGIDWTNKVPTGARPFRIENLDAVVQVSSGRSHICAVTTNGDVACWGSNFRGATGQPASATSVKVPMRMGVNDAVEVAAGAEHTCIRHRDGGVSCVGQMGLETTPEPLHRISGLTNVTALAAGEDFVCGLTQAREVWCAGGNNLGQLGSGDHDPHDGAVRVRDLVGIRAITANGPHACALADDGGVMCWGSEFGHGIMPARGDDEDHGPVRIAGVANAVQVAVGGSHACADLADGTITCWGNTSYGETGQPESKSQHPPMPVVLH